MIEDCPEVYCLRKAQQTYKVTVWGYFADGECYPWFPNKCKFCEINGNVGIFNRRETNLRNTKALKRDRKV